MTMKLILGSGLKFWSKNAAIIYLDSVGGFSLSETLVSLLLELNQEKLGSLSLEKSLLILAKDFFPQTPEGK